MANRHLLGTGACSLGFRTIYLGSLCNWGLHKLLESNGITTAYIFYIDKRNKNLTIK